MLTKKQAQRLNGLISRMEQTAKEVSFAGALRTDDAAATRENHTQAKQAVTDYVRSLTETASLTGSTTDQIKNSPQNAIYVWPNSNLFYPRELARHLGRTDIKFLSAHLIRPGSLHMRGAKDVVLDHATCLNPESWEEYRSWKISKEARK